MKQEKKNKATSTQLFTEIKDIVEHIVLLNDGSACSVLQIEASNFLLLSDQEQYARINGYASLLNSLSFPVQILIRNKQVDVSAYIQLLNQRCEQATAIHASLSEEKNKLLFAHIRQYRDFVQNLVQVNTVLDKTFYMVFSYSSLERSLEGTKSASFIEGAKAGLSAKMNTMQGQLQRLSLRSKVMEKEDLVRLFYDMYNEGQATPPTLGDGVVTPVVKGEQA